MIWALWSLNTAAIYGCITQMNRYWQLPGKILVRWRGFGPALAALPFVFLFPPPASPVFYLATFISSLLVPLHDARMFDISGRYGGTVALRLRSLMLPLVFLGWLVMAPDYGAALLRQPVLAAGIGACLALITYFLFQLKRCAISRAAMREMIPVILMGAVFDISNKTAMDHAGFPSNIAYYVFMVSGMPVLYGLAAHGKKPALFVREMAQLSRQGVIVGALWAVMMASKNVAMMIAPNPAYVTAMTSTAPFWASLLARLRGEKEEADWLAGTGLVLCIIALTVLSSFVPRS